MYHTTPRRRSGRIILFNFPLLNHAEIFHGSSVNGAGLYLGAYAGLACETKLQLKKRKQGIPVYGLISVR